MVQCPKLGKNVSPYVHTCKKSDCSAIQMMPIVGEAKYTSLALGWSIWHARGLWLDSYLTPDLTLGQICLLSLDVRLSWKIGIKAQRGSDLSCHLFPLCF